MPFTFSHPAIILPLKYFPRKWFSFTGLIIGSMTPDFEYFIRMKVQSNYSHTISGFFWFDLPLALFIAFIFHNVVKTQLFDNLPRGVRPRFIIFKDFKWNDYFKKNWLVVLISILIGTASHLFWDGFTHNHSYFVNRIPELKESILIFDKEIPLLKIAQHFSSLIGFAIILFSISKLPKNNMRKNSTNQFYWIFVLLSSIIILIIRFAFGLSIQQYGHIIVSAISSFFISLILIPLIFKSKSDT